MIGVELVTFQLQSCTPNQYICQTIARRQHLRNNNKKHERGFQQNGEIEELLHRAILSLRICRILLNTEMKN